MDNPFAEADREARRALMRMDLSLIFGEQFKPEKLNMDTPIKAIRGDNFLYDAEEHF